MKLVKNYQLFFIVLMTVAYVLIRFWNLTDSCLFFDEIFSLHAAGQSWGEMFWFVAQDLIHPPLFYILLKVWIMIGGDGLLWVRLFPLIFSALALIPFYLICKQLKLGDWSCILALLLLAVNGCLIKYAQEIRMYSVMLCFGLFSIWLFIRFLNKNKGLAWLILVNVLLVNTHYFGWLIIVSQLTIVLFLERDKLKQTLLMIGVTGLSFLPWVLQVWQASKINANYQQNLGWAEKPKILTLYHFLGDLFEPFYYQQTNVDRAETIVIVIPLILIFLTTGILFFVNWKAETEKREFILLLIFLKLPILMALLGSWILPVSIWGTRHLILTFPLLMILEAKLLSRISQKSLKITFVSAILFFIVFGLLGQIVLGIKKPVWCAWEELASDYEQTKPAEKTKIYVFEDLIAYHLWWNLKDKANTEVIVVKGIEELLEDKAYFIPRGFNEIKSTDQNGFQGERFFVAFRDSKFNELHPPLNILKARGYQIGEPKVFIAQGFQTFLVEVKRGN
jgi:uncharacterized membrane protein